MRSPIRLLGGLKWRQVSVRLTAPARASPAAQEDLMGGLKTLKKSKVDERRYTATFLAERWSLSI